MQDGIQVMNLRTSVITFAASAILFAQGDVAPIKSNASQIIVSSIEATERQWQTRLHYTYLERDENRRRDSAGHVKSQDVNVSRTILVNGVPFDELVEHNGKPPSSGEERKQKAKLEKLKRETPEARAQLWRTQA